MADTTEADTQSTSNGASSMSVDDVRAAFLAGNLDEPGKGKADKAAEKPAPEATADDDSDLEEEDRDESAADDEEPDAEEDEDADLDEEDEDKANDEKTDEKTAKGLEQIKRTEKRMREQIKQERAEMEAELDRRVKAVEKEWGPRIEAAEKFERARERVNIDAVAVLQSLGLSEDRFEHTAQILYTLAKAKDDPKAKTAAAALMKERERDDQLAQLQKKYEEREKADREREALAKEEQRWEAFFSKTEQMASDKTPLTKQWLKTNPKAARVQMAQAAQRLIEQTGNIPKERDVLIALEKDRRQALRDLGIDPKSLSAAKATAAIEAADTKSAPAKKADKKPIPAPKADDKKLSPKEEFLALNGKYD